MKVKLRKNTNFLLHLHPATVNEESISFHRTFGLGGMAALLIVIQFLTGILLRFYYEPFPHKAYESIIMLQNNVMFGQFIRNIHHWSGVFLILITFFHLLRVFLTGAYRPPRDINWILGLILLMLVILSNFTGYLLPWDQLAYWAVTVGTGIIEYIPFIGHSLREFAISGKEINADTLIVFFNVHTGLLPILILFVMIYHFWKVRKSGGVYMPQSDKSTKIVPAYPNLVYKEGVVALVLVAVILIFAVFFNAPLLERANPSYSLNPVKAPWYFAGIQELLMHFHPFIAGFFIPLTLMVMIAFIPYLKYDFEPTGIWFNSKNGLVTARFSAIFAGLLTILLILSNEYIFNFETSLPWLNPVISNGLIPLVVVSGVIWLYSKYLKKKYGLSSSEVVQTIFIMIFVSFIILTLINIFFRGLNMQLTLPWRI